MNYVEGYGPTFMKYVELPDSVPEIDAYFERNFAGN